MGLPTPMRGCSAGSVTVGGTGWIHLCPYAAVPAASTTQPGHCIVFVVAELSLTCCST
jgi:hypothetical protein